jgi:hypothetical protein
MRFRPAPSSYFPSPSPHRQDIIAYPVADMFETVTRECVQQKKQVQVKSARVLRGFVVNSALPWKVNASSNLFVRGH